jgi:hypothetical protein
MRIFSALAVLVLLCAPRALLAAPQAQAAAVPAVSGLRLNPAPDGALELRTGADLLTRVPVKTPALRRGTPALREVTVEGRRRRRSGLARSTGARRGRPGSSGRG